jgi:hypothetical protein
MPSPKVLGQLRFYCQESDDRKKPVPVFACLTYLDKMYEIKCYYVIPICKLADKFFVDQGYNLVGIGAWMSLQQFSKFQFALRGRNWNPTEEISDKDIDTILTLDANAPLHHNMTQQDLPTRVSFYNLPDLSEITTLKMKIKGQK